MRLISVAVASLAVSFAVAAEVGERVCNNCTNESTEPYIEAPAPWDLEAETAYIVPMLGVLPDLPVKAFAPLERTSSYATSGTCLAGVGLMMVIRYKDSPVGPYDEFIIIPGLFANQEDEGLPKLRISRIYVSHKYTTWNGRRNWNIPKHLARFDWTSGPNGSEKVEIYPHDTSVPLDESGGASLLPFFQATFRRPLAADQVQVPLSTAVLNNLGGLGLDPLTLASPPLPYGKGKYGELQGTSQWANTHFGVNGAWASVGTVDLYQGPKGDQVGDTGVNAVGDEYYPNFWPGMSSINVALKLRGATVGFSAPELYN
ncbi:hypothetical protein Micbo1qcDRAFT_220050 [Microdochium bolleyi]|uniref:Uncharacterized protein n=1 Tax=Microdochium bolleyi TaxID=196109 RepID=A0A136ILY3_9PEZI|nr:hypothetical protein Micbo1qcDRAFT_220050 [Microdochium bolleyi]